MRVDRLKEILSMLPDDMTVYIQTTPDDYCQPVSFDTFSIMKANVEERTQLLNPARLLLTAYKPSKS